MCIGTPMQFVSCTEHYAVCDDHGTHRDVDIALIGPQPAGTWVLVFLGAAREVLEESEALQMRDALAAVGSVMHGNENIDRFFTDLIEREPQLPPHLQAQLNKEKQETPQ